MTPQRCSRILSNAYSEARFLSRQVREECGATWSTSETVGLCEISATLEVIKPWFLAWTLAPSGKETSALLTIHFTQ